MTPKPSSFQTITPVIVQSAQLGWPSQSKASEPRPIPRSAWLTRPSSCSIWPKITATTGIGSTYGRNTVTRWKRQPRSASKSNTDKSSAISTSTGTASSSRALCSSAVWNVGSVTVSLKLSRPTQWP